MAKKEKPPEWIASNVTCGPAPTWDSWTDEQKASIAEALVWRDKGYPVSAGSVAEEIVRRGGKATKNIVDDYCRKVLGRRSLANA